MADNKPDRTIEMRGQRTYVADLVDHIEKYHDVEIKNITDPSDPVKEGLFAVVPYGKELKSLKPFLDEYLDRPRRRRGTAKFRDERSFVAHVNRFKLDRSVIFAGDRSQPRFLAVLDYHPQGSDSDDTDWLEHRSQYDCQLSDEWKAWTGADGKAMAQADFAAFVEDRIADVLAIDNVADAGLSEFAVLVGGSFAGPSKLLQVSRGLQINVDTQVREVVTLETGEINVKYAEAHNDGYGQPIKVPNLFVIAIPVFFNGARYRIPVRLRYRIAGGRINWSVSLVRPDQVFDDAFRNAAGAIADATDLLVLTGSPEQ